MFATSVAVGAITALPLVPTRLFGRRFFLLIGLISIVFFVLGMVSRGLAMEPLYLCAAGFLILYEITLPENSPDNPALGEAAGGGARFGSAARVFSLIALALAIVAAWSGTVVEGWNLPRNIGGQTGGLLAGTSPGIVLFGYITSALLLGFALVSMILGHWYLVSRKLSFTPLKVLTALLCFAVLLRGASIALSVVDQGEYWGNAFSGGWTHYLLTGGLFTGCRLVLGIILPAILAILSWRCAKIESNQSATGILYVLVAFVFFGEIVSKHLLAHRGLVL